MPPLQHAELDTPEIRTRSEGLWDPLFGAFPRFQKQAWALLAVWVCAFQGSSFIQGFRPPSLDRSDYLVDFCQDWVTARNHIVGLPVYQDLDASSSAHLEAGFKTTFAGRHSMHPPTSVLMVLPFAYLNYVDAMTAWNLVSFALFLVGMVGLMKILDLRWSLWTVLPLLALGLTCHPIHYQVSLGQFNFLLFALIVWAWRAKRQRQLVWAGLLLGIATTVKLFPAFLLVYFLWRREWRVVFWGIMGIMGSTLVTGIVFGLEPMQTYATSVLAGSGHYFVGRTNLSVVGWWHKLFDPMAREEEIFPLWDAPFLAKIGSLVSGVALTAWLAISSRKTLSPEEETCSFGRAVTTMLLLGPITWEHSLVMALLPLAIIWKHLPPLVPLRLSLLAVFLVIWIAPRTVTSLVIATGPPIEWATPIHTLTLLATQTYALLGLLVLGCWNRVLHTMSEPIPQPSSIESCPAPG